jgi:hypothetical protein
VVHCIGTVTKETGKHEELEKATFAEEPERQTFKELPKRGYFKDSPYKGSRQRNLNGNAELDSIQPRIWDQYIPPTRRNNKKHHNRIFIAMKPPNPNFKQSGISGTAQYQVHKEVPAPRI